MDATGAVAQSAGVGVTVTAPGPAPVVALTAPGNASRYATGDTIVVGATASSSSSGATIARVDFYNDQVLLATVTAAPYSVTFNGAPVGVYTLRRTAPGGGAGCR